MNPLRLELIETEPDQYLVIVNDLIADGLGRDEALGVIAAALFKGISRIPYARPIANRATFHSEARQ